MTIQQKKRLALLSLSDLRISKINLIILVLFLFGCGRDEDIRPMMSMQECEKIIHRPGFPLYAKELAKKALSKWNNGICDPDPVLMYSQLRYTKQGGLFLDLYMSDEDFDVEGIIIKEIHKIEGGQEYSFEERYPVFTRYSAGLTEDLHVYIRPIRQLRKDEEEWAVYVKKGNFTNGYPTMQISLPEPPEVEVIISIYDRRKHISNALSLVFASNSYPLPPRFLGLEEPLDSNSVELMP